MGLELGKTNDIAAVNGMEQFLLADFHTIRFRGTNQQVTSLLRLISSSPAHL